MNKTATVSNKATQPIQKFGRDHSPEEFEARRKMYEGAIPKHIDKEVTAAKVIKIGAKDVLLDLGGKADATLPLTDFKDLLDLQEGTEVKVYVVEEENKEGEIVVSRKQALVIEAWDALQEACSKGLVLEGIVREPKKGGLTIELFNLIDAFLPGSQIDITPVALDEFSAWKGSRLEVMVLKLNPAKNNVVVSRRLVIENEQKKQCREVLEALAPRDVIMGTVKNLVNFGVFVEIAKSKDTSETIAAEELKGRERRGIVGLIPLNEIIWGKKLRHPSEALDETGAPLFEVGKEIKVVVKEVDVETNHITLSTKMLTEDPWLSLPPEVEEKSKITGTVVELTDFGAFVEVQKGVIGLLHVSNIAQDLHIEHPKELLKVGEEVEAMVLSVDREAHELRLGMRQIAEELWQEAAFLDKYAVGTRHKGKVFKLISSGVYLRLEDGITAFLHNKNMSWVRKLQHSNEMMQQGQTLEVVVLNLDPDQKSISVGLRELEKDPWPEFQERFAVGSVHATTIQKVIPGGAIVLVPNGPETFIPDRDLYKEDKTKPTEGETIDMVVIDCIPEEQKILLSHVATYRKDKKAAAGGPRKSQAAAGKATLGDLGALQQLKSEIEENSRVASQKKAPGTKAKKE